jgi:hypothetical protein
MIWRNDKMQTLPMTNCLAGYRKLLFSIDILICCTFLFAPKGYPENITPILQDAPWLSYCEFNDSFSFITFHSLLLSTGQISNIEYL